MPFTPQIPSINPGDPWTAALYNKLVDDLEIFLDGIEADPDLSVEIELTKSRQHLDGGNNALHSFRRYFGRFAEPQTQVRDAVGFGADPTGVTFANVFINQAIASLPTEGGIVYLPPGTYAIGGPIEMTDTGDVNNVILLGSGPSTVLRQANTQNVTSIVDFEGGTGCVLANLRIEGNSAQNTSVATNGVDYRNTTRCMLMNVVINDVRGYGVIMGQEVGDGSDPATGQLVVNCRISNCGLDGIYQDTDLAGSVGQWMVIRNYVHDCTGYGIILARSSGEGIARRNHCYRNGQSGIAINFRDLGVQVDSTNIISGNVCYENTLHGIQVGSNDQLTKQAVVAGNLCHDNGGDGLRLTGAEDYTGCNFSTNVCYRNGGSGIRIEGGLGGEGLVGIYAFTGFEEGGLEEFFSNQPGGTGTVEVQNLTVKSGTYAMRIVCTTTQTGRLALVLSDPDGTQAAARVPGGIGRMSFYFRIGTAPTSGSEEFAELAGGIGSTPAAYLRINDALQIELWRQGPVSPALVETGTTTLSIDTWYRIDFGLTGTDTGTATANVYIDLEPEIVDASVTMTSSFDIGAALIGKRTNRNGNTVVYYFDDVTFGDVFAGEGHRVFAAVPVDTEILPDASPYTGDHQDIDETPISDADFMTLNDIGTDEARTVRMNLQDTSDIGEVGVKIDGVKMTQRWWRTGGTASVFVNAVLGDEVSDDMSPWTTSPATRVLFYRNYLGEPWTTEIFDGLIVGWDNSNLTPTFSEHRISSLKVHVLYGDSFPTGDASTVIFRGNVCFDNGADGISYEDLGGTKELTTFFGNVAFDTRPTSDATQDRGIYLSEHAQNFVVLGNSMDQNLTKDLLDEGTDNDISHNQEGTL